MQIARAALCEVPALARLMADSPLLLRYRVTFDGATVALTDALHNGDIVLGARDADGMLGFAWLSFAAHMLGGAAYLRLLLVVPSAQRRGVGAHLLAAVEDASRARANHLYLLATSDNLGARRFYERHGYRHVGDLPGLVWRDLDEALYWKRLAPQ
jgi:GNAT superfamily N-acetyltransferase